MATRVAAAMTGREGCEGSRHALLGLFPRQAGRRRGDFKEPKVRAPGRRFQTASAGTPIEVHPRGRCAGLPEIGQAKRLDRSNHAVFLDDRLTGSVMASHNATNL